ncbi:MAG: rhomboid family intramembrane serine protease [Bryobacteraceae bacterium]
MPPGVKWLIVVNVALFIAYHLAMRAGYASIFNPFRLSLRWVTDIFAVWQIFTYMFLHDPYGPMHILFNMLFLWMFGKDIEPVWGTRRFLQYYFVCGMGAGICALLMSATFGTGNETTIGASGAIFGLLLAFGVLYPDATILFFLIFPMKAKYAVMLYAALAFFMTANPDASGVSNIAHLGGMIWGYIYLKTNLFKHDYLAMGSDWHKQWKLQRARKKFQVYMRKQDEREGRFRH